MSSKRAPYHRPKPPPEPSPEADAALIEANRDRVLEFEARGYLPSSIRSITKLPIRIVEQILASKARPKRGPK